MPSRGVSFHSVSSIFNELSKEEYAQLKLGHLEDLAHRLDSAEKLRTPLEQVRNTCAQQPDLAALTNWQG